MTVTRVAVEGHPAVAGRLSFWLICAAILVLSLCVNLHRLGQPSVWSDEAVSCSNVRGSWAEGWACIRNGEDCGGFAYFCLLKPVSDCLGTSELALRLPSVVLGLGFTAIMMYLGHALWNRNSAVVIGLLVALHPEAVWWFRQARAYGLELFATAWCLAALVAYTRSSRNRCWHALSLCAACALAVTTHVFGVFLVGGAALFLLAWRRTVPQQPAGPLRVLLGLWPLVVPFAVCAWWLLQMRSRVCRNLDDFWIHGSLVANYCKTIQTLYPPGGWSLPLVFAGIFKLVRDRARPNNCLLLGIFVCCGALVLAGPWLASLAARANLNFIYPRYFLPLIGLSLLPVGYLLSSLPRRLGIVAAIALGITALWFADLSEIYEVGGSNHCDSRNAAHSLAATLTSRDRVLVHPYYEDKTLEYYGIPAAVVRTVPNLEELEDVLEKTKQESASGRIWLVVYRGLRRMDQPIGVFGRLEISQLR